MAPMIDMVFLLLVFFMTVSTLARAEKTTPVELPVSAESKVPDDLSGRGTVTVDHQGQCFIAARPMTLAEVAAHIEAALEEAPDLRIHIRADHRVPYGRVKKVLEACAQVGAYKIVISTYQES